MKDDSEIDGLVGDIIIQTEFLRTALEMQIFLNDEMAETRRAELRSGVRFFLTYCIDPASEISFA